MDGSYSEKDEDKQQEEVDLNKYEIKINLARGEGNLSSSSSEDESEIEEDENVISKMNEIDESINGSVNKIEWASRRIAICNLDWDRLQAVDLMVVLNSFKPETGILLAVSIYLSDFGAERLKEENINGPALETSKKDNDE